MKNNTQLPETGTSTGGHLRDDVLAGIVVFLVALPLCIGIALASNAPPLAGIIAGIVAGLVVGPLSNAQVTISGPAAGLTAGQVTCLGIETQRNTFVTIIMIIIIIIKKK